MARADPAGYPRGPYNPAMPSVSGNRHDPPEPHTSTLRLLLPVLAVAAVGILVYLNSIPNGFVIDDKYQIMENEWITGPEHLGEIFASGVWEFEGRETSYYRPMMFVHYMGIQLLAGRTAWAFHLASVLLHAAVTVLVFLVARRAFAADPPSAPEPVWPATAAALLFAVHPIHTEPVAWIAAVVDLGYTLFALLALLAYIAGRDRRPGWMAVSAAAFLVALLFKESAITIPVVVAAWEWAMARGERRALARLGGGVAAYAAAFAVYLALRWNALGGLVPTAQGAGLAMIPWSLAVVSLAALYVGKLVVPINLNVWHVFDPPAALGSARALGVVGFVVVCVVVWVWAARRRRVVAFAGAVFLIPLLPTFHFSALNVGIASAFAERYLYLPSMGFALVLACVLDAVRRRVPRGTVVASGIVAVLALTYAVGTVARNPVWKDSLTIWEDAVRKSPQSGVAQFNYGAALRFHGRKQEGMEAIRRAAVLEPGLVGREIGKGRSYAEQGKFMKAMLAFHSALILDPGNAEAHFGLAVLYESRGSIEAAIHEYRQVLASRPDFAEVHNNLGVLHASQGRIEEAVPHFEAAVRLRPDDPDYRANLERARGYE